MDIDVKRFDDVTRALTGLADYMVVEAVTGGEEGLVVTVQLTAPEAPCPDCGEYSTRVKSCRTSLVRDAPCGGRPTVLEVVKRAFRCDGLGCPRKSFTETSDQIRARSRVTQRCREVIGRAGHDRSTASVAREYRVGWATAWAAISIAAVLLLSQQPKRPVRRIGIDETRFWWKQPWLTGVFNLETGDLVVLLSGRSKHTVASWLETLTPEERLAIEVAVTDPTLGIGERLWTCWNTLCVSLTVSISRCFPMLRSLMCEAAGFGKPKTGGAARTIQDGALVVICVVEWRS